MSQIIDKNTNIIIAETDSLPFGNQRPSHEAIEKALQPMILSASGWRKVFVSSGDEDDSGTAVTQADKALAGAMAMVFADYLKKQSGKCRPVVTIAMDSRPTGPALADIMCRLFLSKGLEVQYHFISAAPEAMAWAGRSGKTDGFAYISASHNPIGHNGVKFGLTTGGVLDGLQSAELIESFKKLASSTEEMRIVMDMADDIDMSILESVYEKAAAWKQESYENYMVFSREVLCGTNNKASQRAIVSALAMASSDSPVGIIAEHNGSARALSIDREFLEGLGVKVLSLNDRPGQIVHRIVPEGYSLDLCRRELEKAHREDKSYQLGYVPDCDGDRGNLVYINNDGKAEILEAQEVFALSVLAELAFLKWSGETGKTAVAVNGPTSLRIDEIGRVFGAEVHRAEVGEANVVNLAGKLRTDGFTVRILGEGSNGGNITYPAAVRDPLNTAGAMLKLLSLKSAEGKPGLFELWCRASGQMDKFLNDCHLSDIIETLPPYTTTSAFEESAIMKIRTETHGDLKRCYEENYPTQWEEHRRELADLLGICSWEEINTEGIHSKTGIGSEYRSGAEKGGLKILFRNGKGEAVAYIWMRGSGTEPVFRVLADVKGNNPEAEQYLLRWQREMIALADG